MLRETFSSFSRHGGRLLSAAIAFYALLSIAPMLIIALHLAAAFTGEEAARGALVANLSRWVGREGASTLAALVERVERVEAHGGWSISSALSVVLLVYASTRLFGALVTALHHLWDVRAKSGVGLRGKAMKQLRKRGLAFVMVVLVGAMLVAIVVAKTTVAAATRHVPEAMASATSLQLGETLSSFLLATLLFTAIFKLLPDVKLELRDAFVGALVTATLFSVGASLIALWLGRRAIASTYGAAGSLVLLLVWVSYSAQIFFLGAAFTAEWAKRRGRPILPNERTVRVLVEDEAA